MYPLGIDDRLKTTPIVESLVLPHPLYQGDRLSSPTSIGLCVTHPSLNKALEFGVSSPSCQDPSQGVLPSRIFPCEDSIGPVAAVREQSALYRVSFACVHLVLREVCVRFRYLLPFPSLSHRFDHEIREDRAPKRLTPPSSGISSFWLPRISHRFGLFPINSKISPKTAPIRVLDRSVI